MEETMDTYFRYRIQNDQTFTPFRNRIGELFLLSAGCKFNGKTRNTHTLRSTIGAVFRLIFFYLNLHYYGKILFNPAHDNGLI